MMLKRFAIPGNDDPGWDTSLNAQCTIHNSHLRFTILFSKIIDRVFTAIPDHVSKRPRKLKYQLSRYDATFSI